MDRITALNKCNVVDWADRPTLLGRCELYVSLWGHKNRASA